MITVLHIKNIGIIDEITVNLNEGFNALTGETGAGKTLIVDSLNIICGLRFSKEMIRSGESYSLVEVCMYLPDCDISEDGNVIVTREINVNGKNICKINGRLVTVNELKEFMKSHLDIHGQFDNQMIMDEANHITYLDNFSAGELLDLKKEYEEYYNEYLDLKNKLKENYGDEKQRQRNIDLLKYEIDEIEKADLKENEEEALKEKYEIVKNGEKIANALNLSSDIISKEVISKLDDAVRNMSKINHMSQKYNEFLSNLQDAYYILEDLNARIISETENLDFDTEEGESILKRLDLISTLKRKYGSSEEEILKYLEVAKEKLENILNLAEYTEEIKKKIKKVEDNMYSLSLKMHEVRENNGKLLEKLINDNFKDLEMSNANIKVAININEKGKFDENGLDIVRLLICTNKGEEFKSLTKIASGGEISRIILAIKSVISNADKVDSCVFDEIDTGISGKAASKVGEKIREIAKNHQVICITHLAQVAAYADSHYYISKNVDGERTKTNIKRLEGEDVINELARISSGSKSTVALEYATELINLSKKSA